MGTSAREQRDGSAPARIEVIEVERRAGYPVGRMLVSSPLELDAVIRRIPEGRVLALGELRSNLARTHGADYTCPRTTASFLRVVADASIEERASGLRYTAPYWRVVHDDGTMIEELPGGIEEQVRRLAAEGVVVLHLGKAPRLTDVEHYAWHPPLLGKAALRRVPGPPPSKTRGPARKKR